MRCDIVSFGTISVHYILVKQKISACMQASRECCLVCVRIPELLVRVSTAVQYATKCCVTSQDTSTSLSGTFRLRTLASDTPKKFSGEPLSYKPHLCFGEFPFKQPLRHSVIVTGNRFAVLSSLGCCCSSCCLLMFRLGPLLYLYP